MTEVEVRHQQRQQQHQVLLLCRPQAELSNWLGNQRFQALINATILTVNIF
jgi:hypothetical protein